MVRVEAFGTTFAKDGGYLQIGRLTMWVERSHYSLKGGVFEVKRRSTAGTHYKVTKWVWLEGSQRMEDVETGELRAETHDSWDWRGLGFEGALSWKRT
jgi:hypothetical protein